MLYRRWFTDAFEKTRFSETRGDKLCNLTVCKLIHKLIPILAVGWNRIAFVVGTHIDKLKSCIFTVGRISSITTLNPAVTVLHQDIIHHLLCQIYINASCWHCAYPVVS